MQNHARKYLWSSVVSWPKTLVDYEYYAAEPYEVVPVVGYDLNAENIGRL